MRQLPVRRADPPDDAVVVVRAGVLDPASIARSATQCFERYGVHGVSVEAAEGRVDVACANSLRLRRYRQVRLSTVARLRRAGFALLPTFAHPHYTLVLPDVAEITLRRLDRAFDDPIPNPGRA